MGYKIRNLPTIPLLLLLIVVTTSAQVFDITKYGGKADSKTDISQALTQAWKAACALKGAAQIVIPKGTYVMSLVNLEGPCSSSITMRVSGTILAPQNPAAIKGAGWVNIGNVNDFTMNGGGIFNGQGKTAWQQNNCDETFACKLAPMNLRFTKINNAVIQDITSKDSKNFHVNVLQCKNFTFQHFAVSAPADSPNTDGIHIGRSNGVHIINTRVATGDDCVSLGDGSQQVYATNVTCGPGHGISIGSLGRYENEEPVNGVFVRNCTLTGTDNGVRIKSWPAMFGGSATDIHFEGITLENVANPILIDQTYCPHNQCNKKGPSKVKISNVSFKNIKGTTTTPLAVQLSCSSGIPCKDVELSGIDIRYIGSEGKANSNCTNVRPKITGTLNPAGCEA